MKLQTENTKMNTVLIPTGKLRHLAWVCLLLAGALLALPARAQNNNFSAPNGVDGFAYQGYLTDGNGAALGSPTPANYTVQFRIYNDPTAAQGTSAELWGESQTITVDHGTFSVLLGQGAALGGTEPHPIPMYTVFYATDGATRYVEMTVLGAGTGGAALTILPRLRLMPSPYSYLAESAYSAQGLGTAGATPLLSASGSTITLASGATFNGSPTFNSAISGPTVFNGAVNFNSTSAGQPHFFPAALFGPDGDYIVSNGGTSGLNLTSYHGPISLSSPLGVSYNNGIFVVDVNGNMTLAQPGGAVNCKFSMGAGSGAAHEMNMTMAGNNDNFAFWVGNNPYLVNLTASGIYMNPGLHTYGGINVGNGAIVTGGATVDTLNVSGTSSFGSKVTITSGGAAVTGGATVDTLTASGVTKLNGGATIGSAQYINLNGGSTAYIQSSGTANGASGSEYLDVNARGGGGIYFTLSSGGIGPRVHIKDNGYVGIGTDSPGVPLDIASVASYTTPTGSNVWAQGGSGGFGGVGQQTYSYTSIRASGAIVGFEYVIISDRRVKDIVGQNDSGKDLNDIQKLCVTDYRMVDQIANGNGMKRGFIAQEVEKVMPGAVSTSTNFVPDIYKLAESSFYDPTAKTLAVTLPKSHALKVGDRVRLFADNQRLETAVKSVGSEREFTVAGCEQAPKSVFVYGKEVPDFKTVNYDYLFTTGIGAIQELAKEVKELRANEATRVAQVDQKDAQIAKLEREVAEMRATVTTMAQTVREIRSAIPHDSHASFTPASEAAKPALAANVTQ